MIPVALGVKGMMERQKVVQKNNAFLLPYHLEEL